MQIKRNIIVLISLVIIVISLSYLSNKGNEIPNLPYENQLLLDLPVEDRMKYSESLSKLNSKTLFNLWINLNSSNKDSLKVSFVGSSLSFKLRDKKDLTASVTYRDIDNYIGNTSNNIDTRIYLISILGDTATKEALSIIIKYFDYIDPRIQKASAGAMYTSSNNMYDGNFREELSPILEQLYLKQDTNNIEKKIIIANAIAKIGSSSGAKLLLDETLRMGAVDENYTFPILSEIFNPNSIPVFSKVLLSDKSSDFEIKVSGYALSYIGSPKATQVIIDWAINYKDDKGDLISNWLMRVRDEGSIKILFDTIKNRLEFANKNNREGVVSVIIDRCKNISPKPNECKEIGL